MNRQNDLLNFDGRLEAIEKALNSNKTVFKPQEAAEYLGIALGTLYKLTSAGIIPFSKPNGKLIYISRAALDEWMLSNRTKSGPEKEAIAVTYLTTSKRKKGESHD